MSGLGGDWLIPDSTGLSISSHLTFAIIGVVAESEFKKARTTINEFAQYCDYEDYLSMRESLQVGLAMAGVHPTILYFSHSALLLWREINAKPPGDVHDLWIGTMTSLSFE
jgi:hypothetical protein